MTDQLRSWLSEKVLEHGLGYLDEVAHHMRSLEEDEDEVALTYFLVAIDLYQEALEAVSNNDPERRAALMTNLSNHFFDKHWITKDLEDLDVAIGLSEKALGILESENIQHEAFKGAILDNLSRQRRIRYQSTGTLSDLEAAITRTQEFFDIAGNSGDAPQQVDRLYHLSVHLSQKYHDLTSNLSDLDEAILRVETCLETLATRGTLASSSLSKSFTLAAILANLSSNLVTRYEQTSRVNDLEAGIQRSLEALERLPEGNSLRLTLLTRLLAWLSAKYNLNGNLQELDAAIARAEEALESRQPGTLPNKILTDVLNTLSALLKERFERTGNPHDLDNAISHAQQALAAIPEHNTDVDGRVRTLNTLAVSLLARYVRTEAPQDLELAVRHAESVLQLGATRTDDPNRPGYLTNSSISLHRRYLRTGHVEDLEAAIIHAEAAAQSIPTDHTHQPNILSHLSVVLLSRYEKYGRLDDLEAAIRRAQESVDATLSVKDPRVRQGVRRAQLASCLIARYQRRRNLLDLDAAIKQSALFVDETLEGEHGLLPLAQAKHALFLGSRYERTRDLADLEEAIALAHAAVDAIPKDHPRRRVILADLAHALHNRYERTRDIQDLDSCIDRAEMAMHLSPEGDVHREFRLLSMAIYLQDKWGHTGNEQDFQAAIRWAKKALETTAQDHPIRASVLEILGSLHRTYATKAQKLLNADYLESLQLSLAAYLDSQGCRNGELIPRILSASAAAKILSSNPTLKDIPKAYELLRDAVHLMQFATSRSLAREDHQYILEGYDELPSLAAAISLEAGKPPLEALRLLEFARGITNGQLLDYRSDISSLANEHPLLAERFDNLRSQLDKPFAATMEMLTTDGHTIAVHEALRIQYFAINHRNQVAEDLETVLSQIRQKKGFEDFLHPAAATEDYFLSAAIHGPIVILNVSTLRSDAIIVTKDKITSIPLPLLSSTLVDIHLGSRRDSELDDADPLTLNKTKRDLLAWLWKAAVEPVLRELGICGAAASSTKAEVISSNSLPRIWWIGTGLMAMAPIHAAAVVNRKTEMSTLKFCIPSYTPTIRALTYSRSKLQSQQDQVSLPMRNALIVCMPTTPNQRDLSSVTDEIANIERTFGDHSRSYHTLLRPTAAHVLEQMQDCSMVHFACHGISTPNPADSHLLLVKEITAADGIQTEEIDKLRLTDIAAQNLSSRRLAYLSACSTAEMVSSELTNEVTHIASSFQVAGFSHVIASLWTAEDDACCQMASEFYSELLETDDISVAYRNAVLKVRKTKLHQPLYWAPFIHLGA